ncbi:hypothetical protein ACP8Y2_19955 [Herpetosiphon llansteffanensis]
MNKYLRIGLSCIIILCLLVAAQIVFNNPVYASVIPSSNFHYAYSDGSFTNDAGNPASTRQNSVGYTASTRHNWSATSAGTALDTDAVWSMYAHANQHFMLAYNGSSNSNLNNTTIAGYNLSQLKIAVFYGCDTANGAGVTNNNHVTKSAVNAGAGASIGFYDKVFLSGGATSGPAYVWSKYFWESMASGSTINTAAIFARDRFYQERGDYGGVDKYSTWGNGGQKITPAGYK